MSKLSLTLSLEQTQAEFKHFLFSGSNETQLKSRIATTNNIDNGLRLDVYRNAYYIRLEEALAHDYPAVLAAAGDKYFGEISVSYLQDYPSTSPSLRNLGNNLSVWMQCHGKTALSEIAEMEWSVLNAFDAADASPINAGCLATVPTEEWHALCFEFHPSVSIQQVSCNARDIWAAVRNEKTPVPHMDENVNENLIIWRAANGPSVQAVDAVQYRVMRNLNKGKSFSVCCLDLADHHPEEEVPQLAAKSLALALNSGWIVKMTGNL